MPEPPTRRSLNLERFSREHLASSRPLSDVIRCLMEKTCRLSVPQARIVAGDNDPKLNHDPAKTKMSKQVLQRTWQKVLDDCRPALLRFLHHLVIDGDQHPLWELFDEALEWCSYTDTSYEWYSREPKSEESEAVQEHKSRVSATVQEYEKRTRGLIMVSPACKSFSWNPSELVQMPAFQYHWTSVRYHQLTCTFYTRRISESGWIQTFSTDSTRKRKKTSYSISTTQLKVQSAKGFSEKIRTGKRS